ncbi:hypothetical protein [Streptomyces decoyicus]|uniref:hypothetical protein n=1 Tax=Streptomyces decoyicus TaxID=249567 RepID=UPI0038273C55
MAKHCENCGVDGASEWWPKAWERLYVLCFPCALRKADPNIPPEVVEDAVRWCSGQPRP